MWLPYSQVAVSIAALPNLRALRGSDHPATTGLRRWVIGHELRIDFWARHCFGDDLCWRLLDRDRCWGGRLKHAMGAAAQPDSSVGRRSRRQDHCGDHHHRHWAFARVWRHLGGLSPTCSDCVRSVDRVCGIEFLPLLFLVRWWRGDLMDEPVSGFVAPVHRALTEPILMGGAPRSIAIVNGTVAAALGLGLRLWIAGLLFWFIGHMAAVWAAKRDPDVVEVVRRYIRIPAHLNTWVPYDDPRRIPAFE